MVSFRLYKLLIFVLYLLQKNVSTQIILDFICFSEEPVRAHLKNVYACLTMSTIAAAAGAYVHMYTDLMSAGLLTVIAAVGFLFALMSTPDNGKNRQMRVGFLLGFAFFSGLPETLLKEFTLKLLYSAKFVSINSKLITSIT